VEVVLMVDAYHEFTNPRALLHHFAAALKPGGRIGVVEFTKSGGGPGPPPEDRIDEERVIQQAAAAGLTLMRRETFLLPYQYFLIFGRGTAEPATSDVTSAETGQAPGRR
jgi:hypothetical protein